MADLLTVSSKYCALLISTLMLLQIIKSLRGKRGAVSALLNFNDIVVVMLLCTFWFLISRHLPFFSHVVVSALVGIYGCLLWLDALLFIQYRIEINRQTIVWFFTGSKGIKKGIPFLFEGLKKLPVAWLCPFLWLGIALLMIMGAAIASFVVLMVICVVCWAMSSGDRFQQLRRLFAIGFVASLATYQSDYLPLIALLFVVLLYLSTLLFIGIKRVFPFHHTFFTSPTLIGNMLLSDTFVEDDKIVVTETHSKHIPPLLTAAQSSAFHAKLPDANVILITLESLGAYVPPYRQDAAHSLLSKRFLNNAWVSKQHFCLCPNTTVSTNQIYTGFYSNNPYNKDDSLFPGKDPHYISSLKRHGYKTFFLDSADTHLYDYQKLLDRIGFDRYWGTHDMPSHGLKGDYRLWNMVENLSEEIGDNKFFLHLINDQTHMPYEVIDKTRFNRHQSKSIKSDYLNAVEEADFVIDEFLNKLSTKIDLSNTLIVFTGDHGESFGEYGYNFHSNSVIPQQMQVPFMMRHPNLERRTIAHSCHFDLFPTFFDLLGIDHNNDSIGRSLGFDDREFAYLFHSATLKGNSPANFGFMHEGEMLWVDRLFNQVSKMDSEHNTMYLTSEKKKYVKTLLHKMLSHRGILA